MAGSLIQGSHRHADRFPDIHVLLRRPARQHRSTFRVMRFPQEPQDGKPDRPPLDQSVQKTAKTLET
ncbi:MAG TPA: hypothetical protein DCE39_02340 [Planctomycetaceae bacterium]|nr:hypothetical protein [Planctomycetaceae bacterium]